MLGNQPDKEVFERRVTNIERFFSRSPFSIVAMVARIRGRVYEAMLRNAVVKVQQRHTLLQSRIREDMPGEPWFTSAHTGDIPVHVLHRGSEEHWMSVVQEQSALPFDFAERAPIRIVLLHSPDVSDLIIVCHHIICDGLSLAYLARDLMLHLGDSSAPVEVIPDPSPITVENMPPEVSVSGLMRFMIRRFTKKWDQQRVLFDQQDYEDVCRAYWNHYHHSLMTVELDQEQTKSLVARCRREQVTVNSALSVAFMGAQRLVLGEELYRPSTIIAANLRDRLRPPVEEALGFYAWGVNLEFDYELSKSIWDNARRFQSKFRPTLTNKRLFGDPRLWCELDPTILEALNFKRLGVLLSTDAPSYAKLSAFGRADDVVMATLKRDKMESLDRITTGTAVTNLGRLNLPTRYGPLELERLILKPGGGFPLANFNLVLAAVTCGRRLSLLLEWVEQNIDAPSMQRIKDEAMKQLFQA